MAQKGFNMLGSMYSAVSGLAAHQTKMNVIGNNIANVNTYGFKASRVTFSDVFYQTLSGASAPTTTVGGTNPNQLGYGAKVKSIDVINTRAGSATTDRPMDIYINGDGYLPVKDSNGIVKYTRVGVLTFDVGGNLVDSSGNMVLGLSIDPDTKKPKLGADGTVGAKDLVPIKVDPKDLDKYSGIAIGSNGEITAIKEGDPIMVPAANTGWLTGVTVSPSSLYSGNVVLTATRSDEVVFLQGNYKDGNDNPILAASITVPSDADVNGSIQLTNNGGGNYTLTYTAVDGSKKNVTGTETAGVVSFAVGDRANPGNTVDIEINVSTGTADIEIPLIDTPIIIGDVVASEIKLDLTTYDKSGAEIKISKTWTAGDETISFGDMEFTVNPGKLGAIKEDALDNSIVGSVGPGAGVPTKIANLAVVKFTNNDALSQNGEGYYMETVNSGVPIGTIPGNGGTGNFRAGALEMSNVDLSREFTEMIITQRGFQANTRMITVSDEMLSELVNMKR
jgi:flagellar hook protein FlgE